MFLYKMRSLLLFTWVHLFQKPVKTNESFVYRINFKELEIIEISMIYSFHNFKQLKKNGFFAFKKKLFFVRTNLSHESTSKEKGKENLIS